MNKQKFRTALSLKTQEPACFRSRALIAFCLVAALQVQACASNQAPKPAGHAHSDKWSQERIRMVNELHAEHDITDKNVIAAMGSVPRHLFVSADHAAHAYHFGNLPIGDGQVIGDPYLVAFMTQSLKVKPTDTVLEVGTGCGYQAAVLARLVKQVYSIEIREPLANSARERLKKLGYKNVEVKAGDGYLGWSEHAPFDAIIVTAFPDTIPERLVQQLKPGGRMVTPVGGKVQRMKLITRTVQGFKSEDLNLTGLVLAGTHHKPR